MNMSAKLYEHELLASVHSEEATDVVAAMHRAASMSRIDALPPSGPALPPKPALQPEPMFNATEAPSQPEPVPPSTSLPNKF